MADFERLLGRIYEGFFLRDLLGFVAPGSISLLLLLAVFSPDMVITLWSNPSVWLVMAFLAIAYLWAWWLQSLHYGVVWLVTKIRPLRRRFFIGRISSQTSLKEIESLLKQSPMMTEGALEPDLVYAKFASDNLLEERLRGFPYSERLSALMTMSGNLAISAVVVAAMIAWKDWRLALLLFLISVPLYVEYWRLWQARNLQAAIYAVSFKKDNASNPKDGSQAQSQGVRQ